jgi:hypothetical protein
LKLHVSIFSAARKKAAEASCLYSAKNHYAAQAPPTQSAANGNWDGPLPLSCACGNLVAAKLKELILLAKTGFVHFETTGILGNYDFRTYCSNLCAHASGTW